MQLSVVVPAYNEEKNVEALLRSLRQHLAEIDYEIIIVDDHSDDRTWEYLQELQKEISFKAIRLDQRKGQCFALYRGFQEAQGSHIATLDADLQYSPEDLSKLLPLVQDQKIGCVIGRRRIRTDGLVKKLTSKLGNLINNLVFDVQLNDNNSQLRVFQASALKKIRYFKDYHRFLPVLMRRQGLEIRELPVDHHPRRFGISKYGLRNRLIGNLKAILRVRFQSKGSLFE